jgi:hypothetical protein
LLLLLNQVAQIIVLQVGFFHDVFLLPLLSPFLFAPNTFYMAYIFVCNLRSSFVRDGSDRRSIKIERKVVAAVTEFHRIDDRLKLAFTFQAKYLGMSPWRCPALFSILSYNVLGDVSFGGRNFNDIMDYFSNQILLPLGGLLIAVFAGWAMTRDASREELGGMGRGSYALWRFMIRFVVPPALIIIFLSGIGG